MNDHEQSRLLRLLHDVESDDDVISDDTQDYEDRFERFDENTDTEQEGTDDEEPGIPPRKKSREDYFIAKDEKSIWQKGVTNFNVPISEHNVIMNLPGVQDIAKQAMTPEECWYLFFTDEMLDKIVLHTNNYILSNVTNNFSRERDAKGTDKIEIKAVFGLLYLAGCLKSSRLNVDDLWDRQGMGIEIFWLTMTKERFRFLLRVMHFSDFKSEEERKGIDNLAPIREVFDIFVQNCRRHYNISEYATIGKRLEAFRGPCQFSLYMPNKPKKYGIKIWALVDAKAFYTHNLEIYVGTQPDGPYAVSNDAASIVTRLIKPISGTGRNITADNSFTSFPLIETLLNQHSLTYVGAVRKNNLDLPYDFVNISGRKIASSIFGFRDHVTILSYVPKKGKNVILASSLHNGETIDLSTGDLYKPEILTFYDKTKGAVDIVDELCENYTVARTTRNWAMVVLYSLMNIAGINSQIIYNANNLSRNGLPRRKYLKTLSLALINEHLKRRSLLSNLPLEVRERRQLIAGTSKDGGNDIIKEGTRKKCFECKKNNKTRFYCKHCHNFVCLSHAYFMCSKCIDKVQ